MSQGRGLFGFMTRLAYSYVVLLCAAAAALLGFADWTPVTSFTAADFFGLGTLAFLAIVSEAFATNFVVGPNRRVESSVAFIPLFACAIVFPPVAVLSVVVFSIAITQLIRGTRRAEIAAFNVAQYTVAYGLAALTYAILGGSPGRPLHVQFGAYLGMASVFFVGNVLLVTAFMALRRSGTWSGTIMQAIGPGGGNLLYDLLSSPIAVFVALLYDRFSAPALLLVALPLFMVRHSYNAKLQLERVNKDLLRVLVKAIETRDPYTSGHSIRVANLARAIGKDLGLRRRALEELEMAALLHDIGKIEALYASVISKPHELSPSERALIRTHSTMGSDMLLGLSAFSEGVIRAVRHHHERYDGAGYPDGLSGRAIPLAARIIMVCDSVDAMLSDRPYRSALSLPVVESELRKCSGTQFDPEIVQVVLTHETLQRAEAGISRKPEFRQVATAGVVALAAASQPAIASFVRLQQ